MNQLFGLKSDSKKQYFTCISVAVGQCFPHQPRDAGGGSVGGRGPVCTCPEYWQAWPGGLRERESHKSGSGTTGIPQLKTNT